MLLYSYFSRKFSIIAKIDKQILNKLKTPENMKAHSESPEVSKN